jgi:cell division protein ZapA
MSVIAIEILNKKYKMGCEDGQESRLQELAQMADSRARAIMDKIGPMEESAMLATLCIVLADEIKSRSRVLSDTDAEEILARVRQIKKLATA